MNLTAICLLLFLSLKPLISNAGDDKNYNVKLQIINGKNNKTNNFLVKIVKKKNEKEKGLMWVKNLPKNHGMLFEFTEEKIIYMWMKNTKIPLDMLFIDKNYKIIEISHNNKVDSLEVISSKKPASKVLEINGGLAKELGIVIGNEVSY
jgi:uncharacterized membrane protein (UPF0127 family)